MVDRVAIIGQGFVGTALKESFSKYHDINTYDKFDKAKSTHLSIAEASKGCDAAFVCVPTPMRPDGSCDTSIVESVCGEIDPDPVIVIKSTVPPGTTTSLGHTNRRPVVFNPEFLLERNATEDFKNTNRVILGGHPDYTRKLKQFYVQIFPQASIIQTQASTAEFVKYLINCFLAAKVSIANEFHLLCNEAGVDYDKVIEYATHDDRLGKTHFAVPGPDGKLGFGGSCFPKDLNGIIQFGRECGITLDTLEGAWRTNLKVRPEKDWEQLKGRAVQ
jgi:nucleotide sugar dehydrogenase